MRTIRRIRDELGINLFTYHSDHPETPLGWADDPLTIIDMIWISVAPQAAEIGVTVDKFLDAINDSDIAENAGEAFVQAFIDFFRNSPAGKIAGKALLMAKEIRTAATAEFDKKLQAINPEQIASKILKLSAGGSEES